MKNNESITKLKSYSFALKIIHLAKELQNKKEYIISKQINRSGTSIGAMVEESTGAQSQKDFYHKISIAYKEARETKYWLNLLKDSKYISEIIASELLQEIEEIIRLLGATISTMKRKLSII